MRAGIFSQRGLAIKQAAPLARTFGAGNFSGGFIYQSVGPVPKNTTFANKSGGQFFSQHRFYRVSPQSGYRPATRTFHFFQSMSALYLRGKLFLSKIGFELRFPTRGHRSEEDREDLAPLKNRPAGQR